MILALSACSGNTTSAPAAPQPTFTPPPTPTATPTAAPTIAPGTQIASSPINHVIIVMMENRTTDNLFYGFVNPVLLGAGVPAAKAATMDVAPYAPGSATLATVPLESPVDPSHSYQALLAEYAGGALTGFANDPNGNVLTGQVVTTPGNNFALGAVPTSEVGLYWQLGGYYAMSDRFFSSKLMPSFPGHQFLIAGQSPGSDDPPLDPYIWGCDSRNNAVVNTVTGPNDTFTANATAPCFDYQTLGDLMDAKNVSWKYYTGAIGTFDGTTSAFDAVRHIRYGTDWTRNVTTSEYQLFTDISNNTLPNVSWITPPSFASDHSATLNAAGPGFVANIYQAIAQNPKLYANTVVFVTWDDAGGWYDHVKPPLDANGNPLGFRVPLLALSPYAKQAYVSHATGEFGSLLKFVENNWALGSLGTRDAAPTASDLSDMFNYAQTPLPPVPGTIAKSAARATTATTRAAQGVSAVVQQTVNRYPLSWFQSQKSTQPMDNDK